MPRHDFLRQPSTSDMNLCAPIQRSFLSQDVPPPAYDHLGLTPPDFWHPFGWKESLVPTPRIYLYDNFTINWNPRQDDYQLHGYIEMEDIPFQGVIQSKSSPHIPSTMFFDRFELELKLAMSPNSHHRATYELQNRSTNPEAPYEFRDANGTKPGSYALDSRIQFGEFQAFTPGPGAVPVIRYHFNATIPNRVFADYGPDFHRYIELEARAWFFEDVFPKIGYTRPVFAVRYATDTYRAYLAPYTKYHIPDWKGMFRAPFAAQRFHKVPLLPLVN